MKILWKRRQHINTEMAVPAGIQMRIRREDLAGHLIARTRGRELHEDLPFVESKEYNGGTPARRALTVRAVENTENFEHCNF